VKDDISLLFALPLRVCSFNLFQKGIVVIAIVGVLLIIFKVFKIPFVCIFILTPCASLSISIYWISSGSCDSKGECCISILFIATGTKGGRLASSKVEVEVVLRFSSLLIAGTLACLPNLCLIIRTSNDGSLFWMLLLDKTLIMKVNFCPTNEVISGCVSFLP